MPVHITLTYLLPHEDLGRFLVQSDAKPFQLTLDDSFIAKGLEHVQNDENQMACSRDWGHRREMRVKECVEKQCTPAMTDGGGLAVRVGLIARNWSDDADLVDLVRDRRLRLR